MRCVGGDRLNEPEKVVGGEHGVIDGVLCVGDVEEWGVQDVMEGCEIVITWLSHDGLEGSGGRGKDCSDFFGHHDDNGRGVRCPVPLCRWVERRMSGVHVVGRSAVERVFFKI